MGETPILRPSGLIAKSVNSEGVDSGRIALIIAQKVSFDKLLHDGLKKMDRTISMVTTLSRL